MTFKNVVDASVGNSVGTVISKEALARMNVQSGDILYLSVGAQCGYFAIR